MCHLRPDLCPHNPAANTYYEARGITDPCVFCHDEQAHEDGFCGDACREKAALCDDSALEDNENQ